VEAVPEAFAPGARRGEELVKCNVCDRDFTDPGGLLFSPPEEALDQLDGSMAVLKYHVCPWCWFTFVMALISRRPNGR
jgi:hypothetical protein